MTRKHFVALAEAISSLPKKATRIQVALAIFSVCRSFNGRADRQRFLSACGVE